MRTRIEHRKSKRIPKTIDASVARSTLIQVDGHSRIVPALISDVSLEGIGLVAVESFSVNARVRVNISLHKEGFGSRILVIPAAVCHCSRVHKRGFKVGLLIDRESADYGLTIWTELVRRWSAK